MLSTDSSNPAIDLNHPHLEAHHCDRKCKTIPLVDNFSTCLTNDVECEHIFPFGFSYLCLHPKHRDFTVR